MKKMIFLTTFLGLLSFFQEACAYGHSKELGDKELQKGFLITPILENRSISYCLDIRKPQFKEESLQIQVEMILSLWTAPLKNLGLSIPNPKLVSCNENFDLKIEIGPEEKWKNLGAYYFTKKEKDHVYSYIKINTEKEERDDHEGELFLPYDMREITPEGMELYDFLQMISQKSPQTVSGLAEMLNVSYTKVYLGSYSTLIHEMGHAFGLCDLYGKEVFRCDPKWISQKAKKEQPNSIMKNASFFYLTEDDVEAIKSVYKRLRKK